MTSNYYRYKARLYFFSEKAFFFCFILFFTNCLYAQEVIITPQDSFPLLIGGSTSVLVDKKARFDSANIIYQTNFIKNERSVLILSSPKNNVWIKFKIKNFGNNPNLYLSIDYADISISKLYEVDAANHLHLIKENGNSLPFDNKRDKSIHFNFPLDLQKNKEKSFYLNTISNHPYELPLYINTYDTIISSDIKVNLIMGLYSGIMISIILYNLFLFFSTKDKNNLVYVIYLFTLWLAQITIEGWAFKLFWPNFPSINSYAVISTSCLVSIMAVVFARYFLNVSFYSPFFNKLLLGLMVVYSIATFISFTNYAWISYMVFNYFGIIEAIVLLITAIIVYRRGHAAALFYFIAWSMPLLGFIIYLLKNLDILPFNDFTHFALYIGSAIEAILLSLALANKINILRDEKEFSQAEALQMAQENEKLIQEQNVMLENQVAERTYDLENTLRELKDAQIQLVESEKMASLGQLTAGIAHEINNPINFVKSNVSPLQMDVQDLFELINEYQKLHRTNTEEQPLMLKQIKTLENKLDPDFLREEIESLIEGIEEGAERTAEIVRGLRSFSRLDESEMKEVNIYENINSTLVLLRNNTPHYLKIRKHFSARPEIECYPGKLNQVFMNILTNCIQAIVAKPVKNTEEYIDIDVKEADEFMKITISDTGIGMNEEVKHKIFDPFFTTKGVGEGTGLGMSIVFKIIEKHHGKISVHSLPDEGASFMIAIPYTLKNVSALAEN